MTLITTLKARDKEKRFLVREKNQKLHFNLITNIILKLSRSKITMKIIAPKYASFGFNLK